MSIKARVEPFVEDFVELGLQSEDVADAGRGWRHPFGLLLFEFEEIEIVTAISLFFGASKSFLGNREEREAGWKGERFLRAAEHDVDAERIHVDLNGREGGDGIDDEN